MSRLDPAATSVLGWDLLLLVLKHSHSSTEAARGAARELKAISSRAQVLAPSLAGLCPSDWSGQQPMSTAAHLAWSYSMRNNFCLNRQSNYPRVITKISTFHSFLLEQDNSTGRYYAIQCWKFLWTERFNQWKWRIQKVTNAVINTEIFTFFSKTSNMCQGLSPTATKQSWEPLAFLEWKCSPYRTDSQLKAVRTLQPNHLLPPDGASCLVYYPALLNFWALATQMAQICSFSAVLSCPRSSLVWDNRIQIQSLCRGCCYSPACYILSTLPLSAPLLVLLPVPWWVGGSWPGGGCRSWQFHSLTWGTAECCLPQQPCAAPKHWLLLGIEGGTSALALGAMGQWGLPVYCPPPCARGSVSKGHRWLCCPSVYLRDTVGKYRAEDGLIRRESSSLKVGIINNQPSGKDWR